MAPIGVAVALLLPSPPLTPVCVGMEKLELGEVLTPVCVGVEEFELGKVLKLDVDVKFGIVASEENEGE
jgi:hypothetical protein